MHRKSLLWKEHNGKLIISKYFVLDSADNGGVETSSEDTN